MPDLEEELRLCQQAGGAALRAASAQILLLQKELSRVAAQNQNQNNNNNFNMNQQSSSLSSHSGTNSNLSQNQNLATSAIEEECNELRKEVRHLQLEVSYHQRLASNAAADRGRLEREVLNLQEGMGELREQLDLATHQLRHYENSAASQSALIQQKKEEGKMSAEEAERSLHLIVPPSAKLEQKLRKRVEERNRELSRRVNKLTQIVNAQETGLAQFESRFKQATHYASAQAKRLANSQSRVEELKQLLRVQVGREVRETVKDLGVIQKSGPNI